MRRYLTSIALMAIFACNPGRHSAGATVDDPQHDGSSYEKAIVIKESSETTGVAAEYKWVGVHYPGAKTEKQALSHSNGSNYDILTIRLPDGTEKDVYFDISRFFGRF